ncbi:MAG TPA: hypothetical protein DCL40_00120, partial [Coxiellaceae bacterium]|nr:hypothetical protein [Coxiellaceae bacterium]
IQSIHPTRWVSLNSPLVLIASLVALHDRTVLWSARKHHWSECLRMLSKDSSLVELKSIRLEYDAWFFNSATIDLLLQELISPHSGGLLSSILYEVAEESVATIDGEGHLDCSFFGDSFAKLFQHDGVALNDPGCGEVTQFNRPL